MRSREVERKARRIVREAALTIAITVECPKGLRRIGNKGDSRHVGKVIILSAPNQGVQGLADWQGILSRLCIRMANEIDDVNTVLYDITVLAP